ncbi:MAG: cytochrome c biogenesis protein CcsA [Thermodesulfobacteriota bacterium]
MSGLEWAIYIAGLGLYAVLSAVLAGRVWGRWGASVSTCRALCLSILLLHGLFAALRWAATSHPPILGTFEETMAASWAIALFTLLIDRELRLAPFTIPFALLICLYGLSFDVGGKPLVISEQSLWVYFHALFAWIAWGFYVLGFASAAALLIGRRWEGVVSGEGFFERVLLNCLLNGFIAHTVMFVLGSYYSSRLHGSWWVWDPVEYLFVVSWFVYAVAIHGRVFYGWKTMRVAVWFVWGFAASLLLYWGLVYFPWATYHVFDPEMKVHM